MRNPFEPGQASQPTRIAAWVLLAIAPGLLFVTGCGRENPAKTEYVYVAVPEASLRDKVATIYAKTGVVHSGERLLILERMPNKRFVRVRAQHGEEGWLQERYLADQATFDRFQRLAADFRSAPAQGTATVEKQVNVHTLPGRKTGFLYQLNEKQKVDLLQRRPIDRNAAPVKEDKPKEPDSDTSDDDAPEKPGQPAIWEDWWLVRDAEKRVGWVLGHVLYLDVPDEIAQYAEGQRIVAVYKLDEVPDKGTQVAEYLVLLTEPKDGAPYDFSQARVYTWNTRKHRYETAYRERNLEGSLPVTVGRQDFEKEGSLRTFTLNVKDAEGDPRQQLYKFKSPIVRKVAAPGEKPTPKPHSKKK
jgi:hypothetical protein